MNIDVNATEKRILDNLRGSFIERSLDKLTQLGEDINLRTSTGPDALSSLLKEIHILKGMGGTFGFDDFTQIAARLELYFTDLSEISVSQLADIKVFLSRMNDCLQGGDCPCQVEIDLILAELPKR